MYCLLSDLDGFFTENLGQLGEGAGSLYCQGSTLSVALGPGWVSYLHRSDEGAVLVRIDLEGANAVEPVGMEPMPHPTNFFKGDDPDSWVVGARSYRQVLYKDLWSGIDLRYRFAEGSLKYDLIVAPQADLDQVRFSYRGQSALSIDATTGDLVIHTPVVDLVDTAPVSFQDGDAIASRFLLLDGDTVAIEVDGRDPSLPLVIDPGLTFSTYIGGDEWEVAKAEVDEAGDILLGGFTRSSDFPTTPGVVHEDTLYDQDAIILKLKGDGSQLLFSTYIGTDGYDGVFMARTDPDGNVVTAGFTDSPAFPTTPGAFQRDSGGLDDGWVMKLNHNCSEIIWCTLMGGIYDDGFYDVEPMPDGNVMVAGASGSPDYPVVDGCYQTIATGFFTTVVSILSSDGTELLRSTYLGGSYYDFLEGFAVTYGEDPAVYLTSNTQSSDHPTSPGAYSRHNAGGEDIVVSKLDINLTQLMYSTYIGGSGKDGAYAIAVDGEGCAYVTGKTESRDFPTSIDALDGRFVGPGKSEAILVKVDPNGTSLELSTFFGGAYQEKGVDVAVRDDGLLAFAMTTNSEDHPTTEHAVFESYQGEVDIYIGVLDVVNQTIRYGSYIGGWNDDSYPHITTGPDDEITLTGYTYSSDYPITQGAFDSTYDDWGDIVVTRFQATLSDPVPPDRPTNLTAWSNGTNVQLEWDLPSRTGDFDLWGLRVYRGPSPDSMALAAQLPGFATNWTDDGVEQGKTYFYAVASFSPGGESPRSDAVRVVVATMPDPPGNLNATASPGKVGLTWTAPNFTGWLPLEGYHLLRGTSPDRTEHLTSLSLVQGYVDEDVVTGITYHYRLCAHNRELNSTFTSTVSAVPLGPPRAPLDVLASPGDGSVTLSWKHPDNDGGNPITIYRVLRGTDPGSLATVRTVGGEVTEILDEDVKNGGTYHYAVIAVNGLGEGPMSDIVSATPIGPPGAPLDLEAVPDDGQVHLTWASPEEDGGLPILGYTVLRGISEAHLVPVKELGASETSYTDVGLTNGRIFYYCVRAHNAVGNGTRSHPLEVTPLGPPGSPLGLVVDPHEGAVSMSWLRPSDDGGSAITNYLIYRGTSPDDLDLLVDISEAFQTYWDDQVVAGTTYHYAISAVTVVDEGSLCEIASAMPVGPPGTPSDLQVISGDREVTLTWTPPGTDGGSLVTGYVVMRGDGPDSLKEHAWPPVGTSYLDTEVINGRTYHYAVAAINDLGTGEPTEPIPATPTRPKTVPSEISILYAQPKERMVTLTWGVPSDDGGTPITGYVILRGTAADALERIGEVGPDATTYTDEAVKWGTTYYYSVVPINEAGEGGQVQPLEVRVPEAEAESPGFQVMVAVLVLITMTFIASKRRR